ncbi:MAG: hypothetical protein OXI49_06660 [Acidobacteriota bacterium]|nr:hypothetical protein [Acidobacteriota bacterium]
MSEKTQPLPKNTGCIHEGYFFIFKSGEKYRWRYMFEGKRVVTNEKGRESKEECLAEIKTMRGCAGAPVYEDE